MDMDSDKRCLVYSVTLKGTTCAATLCVTAIQLTTRRESPNIATATVFRKKVKNFDAVSTSSKYILNDKMNLMLAFCHGENSNFPHLWQGFSFL